MAEDEKTITADAEELAVDESAVAIVPVYEVAIRNVVALKVGVDLSKASFSESEST